MISIIPPSDFITSPWKNGGGVTHEIMRDGEGDAWRWRLSIAEVASDGPFSKFAGLSRVLTVIEGAGLELHTPQGVLRALPRIPLAFSGDLAVDSRMIGGPVRDLNVIFDAHLIDAEVRVISGPASFSGPKMAALVALEGEVSVSGSRVPTEACALGDLGKITLGPGAVCALITLVSKPEPSV